MDDTRSEHESRIVELESRMAFQDDAVATLNRVVVEQHERIEALSQRLERALSDLERLRGVLFASPGEEPPPPHY